MRKPKPTKPKRAAETINAIQLHLDGQIDVSTDHGQTWQKFEGQVFNAALIEYKAEIDFMNERGLKV